MSLISVKVYSIDHHDMPPNLEKTILDSLPIAISVQTKDLTIIYENKVMVDLIGSYMSAKCWNRWNYLTDYIKGYVPGQCLTCPHKAVEVDHKPHTEFREILSSKGETLYVEINHIPLFNDKGELSWFIETIKDISENEKARILAKKLDKTDTTCIMMGLIRFGDDLSNKVMFSDELCFVKDEPFDTFYLKILSYYFVILGQGNKGWQTDVFGPLPILDYVDYQSVIYTFKMHSDTLTDERMANQDYLMLLFMIPRDYVSLFDCRSELLKLLNSFFLEYSTVEEMQEDTELINLLREKVNTLLYKNC